MPWSGTLIEQKTEFIQQLLAGGVSRRELCRAWGVSPKTAYKWLARYEAAGPAGLEEVSRRPTRSPGHTPAEIEAQVLAIRAAQPAWGARKIAAVLARQQAAQVPALSTITAILRRSGSLARPRPTPAAVGSFEREQPNEMWQMDFKGHFALRDGSRCHPLLLIDDHSRYCLAARACSNQQGETVRRELEVVFQEYGLPDSMLMDNGSPWGNDWVHVYTPFVAWLLRLHIQVLHGRPRHPQTQGKLERTNRTLDDEFLKAHPEGFENRARVQPGLDRWRWIFCHERPHEALGMEVPASRYRPSTRTFPSTLPPIEYEANDDVRKVQDGGRITYRGREWRLPKAFKGFPVALRPTEDDGKIATYFCQQRIAVLDLATGTVRVVRH
jgi:transposase InsO family protein